MLLTTERAVRHAEVNDGVARLSIYENLERIALTLGRPEEDTIGEVPEEVRAAARAAFRRYRPDDEVAGLVFDSLMDLPGGVSNPVRYLRFSRDQRTVELEVRGDRNGLRLDVHVTPPRELSLEIRSDGPPMRTNTDRNGQARIDDVPSGLVSVLVTPGPIDPVDRPITTAWVRL